MEDFYSRIYHNTNFSELKNNVINWLQDFTEGSEIDDENNSLIDTFLKALKMYKRANGILEFYIEEGSSWLRVCIIGSKCGTYLRLRISDSSYGKYYAILRKPDYSFLVKERANSDHVLFETSPMKYREYKSFITYHQLRNKYKDFSLPSRFTNPQVYVSKDEDSFDFTRDFLIDNTLFLTREKFLVVCSKTKNIIFQTNRLFWSVNRGKEAIEAILKFEGIPFSTENPDEIISNIEKLMILRKL